MKTYLSLFFLLITFVIHSQITVKGVILDENNLPLPYVNVIVKKTTIGTTTDDNGKFTIKLKNDKGKLEISTLGYETLVRKVSKKNTFIKITLKEEASQLDEIIIVTKPKKRLRKKKNPAYRILKEVWSRKKKNGIKLVEAYQYKKILNTEIGVNNVDSIFLKKIFKEDYKTTIDSMPFNETGVNYYIPLFLNEKVVTHFGNNKIDIEKEVIEAERNSGLEKNGFIFERFSNTLNEIDIHKNNVPLLKKSFVSPISTTGFETYDYVLQDSVVVDNRKQYQIYFFPRRKRDLAFEGFLWIADKNFAVTKVKMRVHKDTNLNFVRELSFEKEYIIKDDSIYLPKKDVYNGDFTFTDKDDSNKGLSIKKTNYFSDYVFNKPLSKNFYSEKIQQIRPNQFKREKKYWDTISKNNEETYAIIKTIRNKKHLKKITKLLNVLSTGYINITPSFQLGKYWNSVTKNSVEGLKLKLGFRTFTTTEDRFRTSGFLGYGTKDKKYKFGIESKYLLSYKPRMAIGLAYLHDTEQLGGRLLTTNGLNAKAFDPNALFSRGDNFFLSFVNRTTLQFDLEVKKNFHVGFSFAHNKIRTATKEKFSIDYINQNGELKTQLTDVSSDLYLTYTPGRFEFGYGVEQKLGKNLYPALIINYRKGYKGFLDGSYNYDKIQLNYRHPFLLGKLGNLISTIDAGKTFGTVPLSLLSPIPANQTFWITKGTFSLINYYDFVTDTYASGHFEHHFNGLIFNKLPLINALQLRSVFSFKTVYGSVSNENRAINRSNIQYKAPTDKLYYEYGVGFENIGYGNIRPLRVDFIWRGDHTSINGLPTPKSAIRIGILADF